MSDEQAEREMFKRAEMRWMSAEDSEITVPARDLALVGRELSRLRAVQHEAAATYWRSLLADTAIGLRGQSISPAQVADAIERALAAVRDLETLTPARAALEAQA